MFLSILRKTNHFFTWEVVKESRRDLKEFATLIVMVGMTDKCSPNICREGHPCSPQLDEKIQHRVCKVATLLEQHGQQLNAVKLS